MEFCLNKLYVQLLPLPKIGIIGAMDEEVSRLKEMMKNVSVIEKAGMDFYIGQLKEKEVVIVKSGIGKVNAGICTQILIDQYQIEAVINTGFYIKTITIHKPNR